MPNPPTDTETPPLMEQMALAMGWTGEPHKHYGTIWISRDGSRRAFRVSDLPPWTTDDGTAIRALEAWCAGTPSQMPTKPPWRIPKLWKEREYDAEIRLEGDLRSCEIRKVSGQAFYSDYHPKIAPAICEAVVAAARAMEGGKTA